MTGGVTLAGEPQFLAPDWAPPVMVTTAPGGATMLTGPPLRAVKTFAGFSSTPEVAVTPDGSYAYLTDAGTGRLTVVGLYNEKVLTRLQVGAGAHHLAFGPHGQVWIALGESAKTIAILSFVVAAPPGITPVSPWIDPGHPHRVGSFAPGFLVHDLLFSPDDRQVWITSANTPFTAVFGTRTHKLLFRVPAGRPPQHVAIAGDYAYITSGYGGRIEQVARGTGRVIRSASAPYGSFDLSARDGYVVTVSLLRGTIAIYNRQLKLLRVRHLAPSLKDVVLSRQ